MFIALNKKEKAMSFFMLGASERIGKENRLLKLNELLDWEGIRKYLKGFHPSEGSPLGGGDP